MSASTRRHARRAARQSALTPQDTQNTSQPVSQNTVQPASENVDEIPDDVRAERDHDALTTPPPGPSVSSREFVPDDVLAEQDAADRAYTDS